LVAHLQFAQANTQTKKSKRATKPTHQDSRRMNGHNTTEKEQRTANSTNKKLAVQWLNETLCFVSSFVVADSLVLLNPPPSPSYQTVGRNATRHIHQ